MPANPPSPEQWERLYSAARRVAEIAPWRWMEEIDVFGVVDPEAGEIGFVSVMGLLGEHRAVSVYRGAEGIRGFLEFEENGPGDSPERLLEIPQLQLSFGGREDLEPEDRAVIKRLGLKFRGRHAWPEFRSYRPGYAPWFLEADEVEPLACALEQLCDVALRLEEDPNLLRPAEDGSFLIRTPHPAADGVTWRDERRFVATVAPAPLIEVGEEVFEPLRRLPATDACLEAGCFLVPAPLPYEDGRRPVYPYVFLIVDVTTDAVLAAEVLTPVPSLDAMRAGLVAKLADLFDRGEFLPAEVRVLDRRLYELLGPLATAASIAVTLAPTLPALVDAKESLFDEMLAD